MDSRHVIPAPRGEMRDQSTSLWEAGACLNPGSLAEGHGQTRQNPPACPRGLSWARPVLLPRWEGHTLCPSDGWEAGHIGTCWAGSHGAKGQPAPLAAPHVPVPMTLAHPGQEATAPSTRMCREQLCVRGWAGIHGMAPILLQRPEQPCVLSEAPRVRQGRPRRACTAPHSPLGKAGIAYPGPRELRPS